MYVCLRVKCRYSCQILIKLEFSRHISVKFSFFFFFFKSVQWELSISMRLGRHDEANSRFSQFYERAIERCKLISITDKKRSR